MARCFWNRHPRVFRGLVQPRLRSSRQWSRQVSWISQRGSTSMKPRLGIYQLSESPLYHPLRESHVKYRYRRVSDVSVRDRMPASLSLRHSILRETLYLSGHPRLWILISLSDGPNQDPTSISPDDVIPSPLRGRVAEVPASAIRRLTPAGVSEMIAPAHLEPGHIRQPNDRETSL